MGPKPPRFSRVDPPPGVVDMATLITFLNNRDEIERYHAELQAYIDEANHAVERVVKADRLEQLLADAERDAARSDEALAATHTECHNILGAAKAEAEKTLEASKKSATQMLDEAKLTAAQALDKAKSESARLLANANAKSAQAEKANGEAEERVRLSLATETRQQQKQAELDALGDRLTAREAEVTARESELARKESILRQIL